MFAPLQNMDFPNRRRLVASMSLLKTMTKEIEEEVLEMCNLGMAVDMNATERTWLESIKNLMETLHMTAQQAMDALKVPKSDQAHYAAMLGS